MSLFYSASTLELDALPDLTGKNVIVTGSNTGIGFETVRYLAKNNARVFMASRSEERAKEAIARLEKEINKKVEFIQLDLNDLSQTKKAAQLFLKKNIPLDILINNAGKCYSFVSYSQKLGIMACPFKLSKDGYETQFATNHLGHFQFVNILFQNLILP